MVYKLSAVLHGHKADVRGLAITHAGHIVSCSRDKTAKLWTKNGFNTGFIESKTFTGHTHFVNSVCTLPPSEQYPDGLIITGGNDNIVLLFEPSCSEPIKKLVGHNETVCRIVAGSNESQLLTASWDKTAKLWDIITSTCLTTFQGHDATVWGVLYVKDKDLVVTGSADKLIRLFDTRGTLVDTLKGHEDCVRDIVYTITGELVSCSNDATIKVWVLQTRECLQTFYGHENFIYSLCTFSTLLVSSGEDRSVHVWHQHGSEKIVLPAQSIWAVAILPNLDIVTGSSDGMVRIFSENPERYADEEMLEIYDKELADIKTKEQKHLGGINVADLPGPETLSQPGKKDGDTKMLRENGEIMCYSWSEVDNQWNKIGNVVGGSGGSQETSGKVLYEGKEYDYVFSVDIEDGKAPLKLPYNRTEDPWFAAQAFIHKHFLPQSYLEQVADFIITNSKTNAAPVQRPEFADPFTGGSRYVPSGPVPASGVSSNSEFDFNPGQGVENPFFPQKSYLRFDQANINQILEKLTEFNNSLDVIDLKIPEHKLNDVKKLADVSALECYEELDTLKELFRWPKDKLFPVLDVLRLAMRNEWINTFLCSIDFTFDYLMDNLLPDSPVSNQMMIFRTLSNMFSFKAGEQVVLNHRHVLLDVIGRSEKITNKSLQIALVTLALNLTTAFCNTKDGESLIVMLVTLIELFPKLTESESIFRALVALGSIITYSQQFRTYVGPSMVELLERFRETGVDKVKKCTEIILQLLQ